MKYVKQNLLSLAAVVALSTATFAGGKYVDAVEVEVASIPTVINPIPLYLGVGMVATFIQRDPCPCTPNDPDIKDHRYGIVTRVGADYNQYIGLEGRYLKTLGSDTFSNMEHYGLYLKPQYHIADKVNAYGLLGYGRTKIDYTNGKMSSTLKENTFSYGAGIEYDLTTDETLGEYSRGFDGQGNQEKSWGLWIDLQHLLSNAGMTHTDSNIITTGITYDF